MKKVLLVFFILSASMNGYSQEYIEVLRASDNNILINPALAGIDGRNSLSILYRISRLFRQIQQIYHFILLSNSLV